MDFIDHIIYTANTANVRGTYPPVLSDFASITTLEPGTPGRNETTPASPVPLPSIPYTDSYDRLIRDRFIYYEDPIVIERAIQKHWYDINNGPINLISASVNLRPFDVNDPPPYHLIYAYLMENTRIAQIMERLIYLYQQDEVLGVASPTNDDHRKAMQWIMNTENLFYKTLSNTSYRNITGNLRPNPESSRRNAYFRMFGIDLAFDNTNILDGGVIPYYKAKSANKEFIPLVEQFLAELVVERPRVAADHQRHRKRLLSDDTLEKLLGKIESSSLVQFSAHVTGNGQKVFDAVCRDGHEGIIAKNADAPYRSERTRDWLKVKCHREQEFVVGGASFMPGRGTARAAAPRRSSGTYG